MIFLRLAFHVLWRCVVAMGAALAVTALYGLVLMVLTLCAAGALVSGASWREVRGNFASEFRRFEEGEE